MAISTDSPTFREQELAGWDGKAHAYDDYAGRITTQIINPLLDAAGVGGGTRVLDVACGPGYLAGAAAERGANAVGLDFAPSMVAEAAKNFPRVPFQHGDAEALPFASRSFEAVVCGFGLGHLPEADHAIAEAYRVLTPGGRYAFSWWCGPDKHEFFALFLGAVKRYGNLDVPLPPAPPVFRFSDPAECKRALQDAGFRDIAVAEHPLEYEMQSRQQAVDLIYKSSVRVAMILAAQTKEAAQRINEAIVAGVQRSKDKEGFRIGWPALVASAKKPS